MRAILSGEPRPEHGGCGSACLRTPASADASLAQRYQLPAQYLYLPNQFWKHKNHGVIIEALSLLRRDGRSVTVIASGNPSDIRDADYFPGLLRGN